LCCQIGEIFATQFFSARKLKFIMFLRASDVSGGALEHWRELAETFKSSALFAYMVEGSVPDVVDYFSVNLNTDLPLIVAHDPLQDFKFKSRRLNDPADITAQQEFVAGVLTGAIRKVLKSEPVPKKSGKVVKPIIQAVGSNVIELVSLPDKDVLLEVYSPTCVHCMRLRPTYDILGRAVQGDSRIVIAKIDGLANDLPASWGVKGYPTLLWFPAKDKPYKIGKDGFQEPSPKPYWDAGHSLHELVSFVRRQSSFDLKTLKVATVEQLGTLMGDEDTVRQQYEIEDRWARRNEGRLVLSNGLLDWAAGEIYFDGKRWHLAAAALSLIVAVASLLYAALKKGSGNGNGSSGVTAPATKKKSH
jgi:thiol-disulfide isomerase/thioredoxin